MTTSILNRAQLEERLIPYGTKVKISEPELVAIHNPATTLVAEISSQDSPKSAFPT